MMIGRELQLDALRRVFAESLRGTPSAVVVAGEAGIGKTRLLREFQSEASDRARILFGQCVDMGAGAAPYAPIAAMLRSFVEKAGAQAVLEAAGPGREALTVLLPELADGPVDRGAAGLDRLHEVIAVLLESSARDEPTVVVLEDLHWVDDATLTVLRFLMRALTAGRIMLVLSYRSEDVHRGHPLRAFLAELERGRLAERVEVDRLDRDEVRAQAAGILGYPPPADLIDSVLERSEGVPFFVEEIIGLDPSCQELPETLRDLLLARYERLDEPAQHLLRLLSAGGVTVSHELLASVYDRDPIELDAAARDAVLANVLVAAESAYTFRHALVREAIHADLLPGERSRFHTLYAEALERMPGVCGCPGVCDSSEVAEHWFAAHNQAKAFPSALAAMEQARKSYAFGIAAQLGERALDLWQHVPNAGQLAGMTHIDLLAKTASALRNANGGDRSLVMINAAIDESVDRTGPRFARLLRDKAQYLANAGRTGSIPLLEEALELVAPGVDELLRAKLLNMLAARHMLAAQLDEAVGFADEALQIARVIESAAEASVAANLGGLCRALRGEVDEGIALFETARGLAEGDPGAMLHYRVNASDLRYHLGRYEEALALARKGMVRAAELGVERSTGVLLSSNAVDPLLALGRWNEAEALIGRNLELAPSAFRAYLQRAKLWLMLWRGETDAAAAQYRAWRSALAPVVETEVQAQRSVARVVAEIAMEQGDLEAAWGQVSPLLEPEFRPLAEYDLPLLAIAARVLAKHRAQGLPGETSDLDRRGEAGRSSRLPVTADQHEAVVTSLRALLTSQSFWPTWGIYESLFEAELGGDGTGAGIDEWQRAVEHVASGPAHLTPYALWRLGEAWFAAGDRVEAREVLRESQSRAAELGAGLVVQRVDAFALRAGISLSDGPSPRSAVGESMELTARERQVLDLIARGLTNRQIGQELFISAKTASVHVSAILRKLGAASRTEAAFLASKELVR